jgi:hypothetical protein
MFRYGGRKSGFKTVSSIEDQRPMVIEIKPYWAIRFFGSIRYDSAHCVNGCRLFKGGAERQYRLRHTKSGGKLHYEKDLVYNIFNFSWTDCVGCVIHA